LRDVKPIAGNCIELDDSFHRIVPMSRLPDCICRKCRSNATGGLKRLLDASAQSLPSEIEGARTAWREVDMNPLWYVICLGAIGTATVAARVTGVRNARDVRRATQDMREKVQRVFDGGACQAYERVDAIGRRLQDSLGVHGGTHQFTLAQLVRTLHDGNLAYLQLGDAIVDGGSSAGDLQNSLGCFCRKYSELVLLLGDVAQQTGHNIAPDEGYDAWARHDSMFSSELGRLAADPEFQNLSRAVRGFFNRDGFAASRSLKSMVSPGKFDTMACLLPEIPRDDVVQNRARNRTSVH
jgi:hypothetical protein